jgi:uncharacterized protein (TIGR02246 family)
MKRFAMLTMFTLACAPRPNLEVERQAIMRTDSLWLAAAQAKNLDSSVSFWTSDARVMGPSQAPVIGGDAIRKMVSDGFATPGFSVSWHTTDVIVGPSGDVAYSFGTNAFTVPGAKGRIDTLRGQSVVVWRKESDGRWRAAVDAWTPQAP